MPRSSSARPLSSTLRSQGKGKGASAQEGFAYSPAYFRELTEQALSLATHMGASAAGAEASEGCGLSVGVRCGQLETVERNRDKSLSVTVYIGQRRGNASTSDFSEAAVAQTVRAAYDIARYTAQDPCAGLPEADQLATRSQELDLFHPWSISADEAAQMALRCEKAAMKTDARISNSEGASVSAQQSHFYTAHSNGFRGGYASSRHSISVAPIASETGSGPHPEMQRDAWYSSMRAASDLASPEAVGRYAAERALSRLRSRQVPTIECPVVFEAPIAAGLLGSFVQAVSGGALYRRTSFLLDALHTPVWANHIEIDEDPFVRRGKASRPFDDEGVRVSARKVVAQGVLQTYFLNTYTGRKLQMPSTGHAGGSHNLVLRSSQTRSGDDLPTLLKRMGRGLLVIELMGQGVNLVTGDYSRGASGFWVENGVIAYPVHEITIAGNLRDMMQGVQAIGSDAYTTGGKTTGSILIDRMKIAGH